MLRVIPKETVDHLRGGGVVAYPTSTLPGLAALPTIEGLDALFTLKKRPPTKPVSLAVTSLEQAAQLVHVPHEIMALEAAFPKGSMTFVLPAIKPLAPRLGGSSIAVRCVAHPLALALVETVGPVTATSANEAGMIPHSTSEEAGRELGLPAVAILPGECPGGHGSTFVKWEASTNGHGTVTVMREGVIPSLDVTKWWMNQN